MCQHSYVLLIDNECLDLSLCTTLANPLTLWITEKQYSDANIFSNIIQNVERKFEIHT